MKATLQKGSELWSLALWPHGAKLVIVAVLIAVMYAGVHRTQIFIVTGDILFGAHPLGSERVCSNQLRWSCFVEQQK